MGLLKNVVDTLFPEYNPKKEIKPVGKLDNYPAEWKKEYEESKKKGATTDKK